MRLTASIAALLLIFATVSVTAIASLVRIDRQIETINRKWLAGTQLLGDLKNTISEFRVAEGYRFLAADQAAVIQAEFLAERQATAVGDLLTRFERVAAEVDMVDDFERFETRWRDLLTHHRAWVDDADGEQIAGPMGYGSPLQKRYEAVQLAANNLIDDARAAADAEVAAANKAATRVTALVVALSAAAGLLAVGLLIYAELRIARPLGAITSALTQLAGGDRRVRVPELHRRDEIGAMATAFEVFRRNAVALGEAQERAEALARHDALTGLANRRLFASRLESALELTRTGLAGAVMLIDLDRFKSVNDLHGHAVGDLVLCEVAARLRGLTDIGTLVARLGGDEFALIMPPVRDAAFAADEAGRLARRVVDQLGTALSIAGSELKIGASVGIALMPADGARAADVLRAADIAMYRAKREGSGTFRFFESGMDAELRDRAALEADLRAALDAGEIEPHYEPVVELASRRVVGYEAQARWHHPARGVMPPETLMPLLDGVGELGRATGAILRRAVRDAAGWEPHVHLAIDVPSRLLRDGAFPSMVANVLLGAGFPPHRLEIGVAGTPSPEDGTDPMASLKALRELGVRLALADFDKGRPSLVHLRDMRPDKLKLGRCFIATLADGAGEAALIDGVLAAARTLGATTVAGGIDTAELAELLLTRGCDFGQGHLFAAADLAGAAPRPEYLREAG